MSDSKGSRHAFAELHDRLFQHHFTEEELKAYRKVASALEESGSAEYVLAAVAVQNCLRCTHHLLLSCVLPSSPKDKGEKPGSQFGGLGGPDK